MLKEASPIFRGTTEGFPGLRSHQIIPATPTSSNPAIATAFAIESARTHGGKGMLYIADANVLPVIENNVLGNSEREIAIGLTPTEFAKKAPLAITVEQSTSILKKMGIEIPKSITLSNLTNTAENLPTMTKTQISTFIKEATKLAKKN